MNFEIDQNLLVLTLQKISGGNFLQNAISSELKSSRDSIRYIAS